MKVSDYKQILTWLSQTYAWDCNPGPINDTHDNRTQTAVNNFKKAYNDSGPGSTWAPKVTPWGEANNQETWEAYFNCYEEYLAKQLGTDLAGVNALRSSMQYFHQNVWTGCNEFQPRVAENLDSFPCDSNRRVEVVFFDPGEEPALACNPDIDTCDQDACLLYDKTKYSRVITTPMLSAREWLCTWERLDTPVSDHEPRKMLVECPGLPDGTPAEIQVYVTFAGEEKTHGSVISAEALGERIVVPYADWYLSDPDREPIDLPAGEGFPECSFAFEINAGGRTVRSPHIVYADAFAIRFTYDDEDSKPAARSPYTLYNKWACYHGATDEKGETIVRGVPPGGVIARLNRPRLITNY
jgi:hypothetical protein